MIPAPTMPPHLGVRVPHEITRKRRCVHRYQEEVPVTVSICECGTFAIGICTKCGQHVCGVHSDLLAAGRTCSQCQARQDARRREEAREAGVVRAREQREAQARIAQRRALETQRLWDLIGSRTQMLIELDCPSAEPIYRDPPSGWLRRAPVARGWRIDVEIHRFWPGPPDREGISQSAGESALLLWAPRPDGKSGAPCRNGEFVPARLPGGKHLVALSGGTPVRFDGASWTWGTAHGEIDLPGLGQTLRMALRANGVSSGDIP